MEYDHARRPPGARPRASRSAVVAAVKARHPSYAFAGRLSVVGVRGYYRDTLGAVGRNDRAMYDDALFIVADEAFAAFNANTDPSGYRNGRGTGAGKGMASLNPGR